MFQWRQTVITIVFSGIWHCVVSWIINNILHLLGGRERAWERIGTGKTKAMTLIKPTGRRKFSVPALFPQMSLYFLLVHSLPLFPPFTLPLENGPLRASISFTVPFTTVSSLRVLILCSESRSKFSLLIYKCYFYMLDLLFCP